MRIPLFLAQVDATATGATGAVQQASEKAVTASQAGEMAASTGAFAGFDAKAMFLDPLVNTLTDMAGTAMEIIPKLIVAFIFFLIGLVFCKIVRSIVTGSLTKVGFDTVAESLGLKPMLVKAGVKARVSEMIGKLLFWILLVLVIRTSVALTELAVIIDPIEGVIGFLPKVITASIILLVGYIIADVVRNAVVRWGENLELEYAGTLGGLIYTFFMVLILTIAVGELGVDTHLISRTVEVFLFSIGIAVTLALGLGLKPLAHNIVCGVYARHLYKSGTIIDIEGAPAEVVSVGPITTLLRKGVDGFVAIPNSIFFNQTITGRGRVPDPEGEDEAA